jgi:signal transduction histidine kinase
MSAHPQIPQLSEHFEQGLVVRFFGNHRVDGERAGPPAVNDVQPRIAVRASSEDLAARLDGHVEQRLRLPIATIRTIAGVLEHQLGGAQCGQAVAIGDAASRVDAMVMDLLAFVRAGTCGVTLSRARVDLKLVFERVVDAVATAHGERPILFTSDRAIVGSWDADALQTVLSKLLVNAIQHGAARPAIRVTLRKAPDCVVLDVWNPGAILDPDVRSAPFAPFRGKAPSFYKPSTGLGLGLYLVHGIVSAHGGAIDLRTDDIEGTTVQVRLPYA